MWAVGVVKTKYDVIYGWPQIRALVLPNNSSIAFADASKVSDKDVSSRLGRDRDGIGLDLDGKRVPIPMFRDLFRDRVSSIAETNPIPSWCRRVPFTMKLLKIQLKTKGLSLNDVTAWAGSRILWRQYKSFDYNAWQCGEWFKQLSKRRSLIVK